MLVTERRVGESLVIGGGAIVLKVVSIEGGRVRFGIDAPRDVPIRLAEQLENGRPADPPAAADGGPGP